MITERHSRRRVVLVPGLLGSRRADNDAFGHHHGAGVGLVKAEKSERIIEGQPLMGGNAPQIL